MERVPRPGDHAALQKILARHDGERILIAAHGETVEAAHTLLLGLPRNACLRLGFVTDHASSPGGSDQPTASAAPSGSSSPTTTPDTSGPAMTDLNVHLALCQRLLDTDAKPVSWHPGHAGTRVLRASHDRAR